MPAAAQAARIAAGTAPGGITSTARVAPTTTSALRRNAFQRTPTRRRPGCGSTNRTSSPSLTVAPLVVGEGNGEDRAVGTPDAQAAPGDAVRMHDPAAHQRAARVERPQPEPPDGVRHCAVHHRQQLFRAEAALRRDAGPRDDQAAEDHRAQRDHPEELLTTARLQRATQLALGLVFVHLTSVDARHASTLPV